VRSLTQVVVWSVAVVVAIAVGLGAVDLVGASVAGRGPLGGEVDRRADGNNEVAQVDRNATPVRKTFTGDWGSFAVACKGVYAVGEQAVANRQRGWQVFSYEPGPDDDVDAIFTNGRRSVELEVFCNGGSPTIAEMERKRLVEDSPDD
jgi:hypothetical protein